MREIACEACTWPARTVRGLPYPSRQHKKIKEPASILRQLYFLRMTALIQEAILGLRCSSEKDVLISNVQLENDEFNGL